MKQQFYIIGVLPYSRLQIPYIVCCMLYYSLFTAVSINSSIIYTCHIYTYIDTHVTCVLRVRTTNVLGALCSYCIRYSGMNIRNKNPTILHTSTTLPCTGSYQRLTYWATCTGRRAPRNDPSWFVTRTLCQHTLRQVPLTVNPNDVNRLLQYSTDKYRSFSRSFS